MQTRIWQPLGMESDAYWNIDRDSDNGEEIAFCCLNATSRDYAKLGKLMLQQGVWNGQQLLPEGWVSEATRPSAAHLQPDGLSHLGKIKGIRGYQYQWWSPAEQEGDYFAAGVWGQYIYISEPDNLIIVRTSVDPEFSAHMEETIAVFRAIRDQLRAQ